MLPKLQNPNSLFTNQRVFSTGPQGGPGSNTRVTTKPPLKVRHRFLTPNQNTPCFLGVKTKPEPGGLRKPTPAPFYPGALFGGARGFSHGPETYLFRFSVSRAHGIPGNRILSVSVRDRWLLGPPAEPPAHRPVFPFRDLGGGTSAGIADCRVRVTTRAAALAACVSTVHRSPAAAALI